MGYYINPPDCSKEDWLSRNGELLHQAPSKLDFNLALARNHLPICLVQNPGFSAAGVIYDERELLAFTSEDGRHKKYYLCFIQDLVAVGALQKDFCNVRFPSWNSPAPSPD